MSQRTRGWASELPRQWPTPGFSEPPIVKGDIARVASLDKSALGQLLFGLSPFDPIAFAVVAGILTFAGFVATFIPARRALSVDPATTLRADG